MNLEEIEALIEILEGTDISELSIEEEGLSISLKRGANQEFTVPQINNMPPEQVEQKVKKAVQNSDRSTQDQSAAEKTEQQEDNKQQIEAPMVGTFYRSPAPDADPFVEVGDVVKENDILCIIEAMKLMNEIEAEVSGQIAEILVNDGESVEYGQPIFVIEQV